VIPIFEPVRKRTGSALYEESRGPYQAQAMMRRLPGHAEAFPSPEDLLRRLLQLLAPGRARFVLARSSNEPASAALIAELLDRRGGDGRVVLHPSDHPPAAYLSAMSRSGSWRVLPAKEVPGSIDSTARSLCVADAVVLAGTQDAMMRAIWLPPSVLEGFAQLPPQSDGVLVVDDWHSLVEEYLGGIPVSSVWDRDGGDLDPVLVEMFRVLSDVHFVVVTTSSSPTLESAADAIVEIGPRSEEGNTFEVRLVRDSLEIPPSRPYVLHLGSDGALACS